MSVAGGAGAPGDERDPVRLTVVLVTTPRLQTLPVLTLSLLATEIFLVRIFLIIGAEIFLI